MGEFGGTVMSVSGPSARYPTLTLRRGRRDVDPMTHWAAGRKPEQSSIT